MTWLPGKLTVSYRYYSIQIVKRYYHPIHKLIRLCTCYLLSILLVACVSPFNGSNPATSGTWDELQETSQSQAPTVTAILPPLYDISTVTATDQSRLTPTATLLSFSQGPIVIGYSVAGRPLEVYRFGSGPKKRMIVAGIHGGYEWNTIALADQLITLLPGRPDLIPRDVTLFILRSLNPDGDARSHGIYGRANENGVDLNRNWPAHWQAEWPRDGCWDLLPITAGVSPASEPETLALMRFLLSQHVEALINYHSAALGIFPGGQPADAASLSLAETVAAVSEYPYPPLDTGCQYTGQLIDWASMNGIATIDIELSTHTFTDLRQNLEILSVFLNWQR
ncbi:MAG: hypothetical protein E3J37_08570, partial [Anaerolineales bacterium]